MRLLRGLGKHREIKRLRLRAHEAPSPGAFEALAERCIALNRIEEALAAAREGMALFPSSSRLESIHTFARRTILKSRLEELQKERSERPSPAVFNKLADVYMEIGDFDQATRICSSCARHFPLNEHPYLLLGEIRLRRFFSDQIHLDGEEAEQQLLKVLGMNKRNETARLLLAHLYYAVGAIPEMREQLQPILLESPDRSEIAEFLESGSCRLPAAAPRDEDDDLEEDDASFTVRELIGRAEGTGCFVNAPHDFGPGIIDGLDADAVESPPPSGVLLEQVLGSVVTVPGIRSAAFVDRAGEPLAGRSREEDPGTADFPSLAADIFRTAEDAGRRMDLGAFHWCTVEGPFGAISITKVRDVRLAADFEAPVKTDQAHLLLEDLAAKAYSPVAEAADA